MKFSYYVDAKNFTRGSEPNTGTGTTGKPFKNDIEPNRTISAKDFTGKDKSYNVP